MIRQFEYVRVEGQLRDYEGKKHVLVYDIKKVTDWNEMTHHFLGMFCDAYPLYAQHVIACCTCVVVPRHNFDPFAAYTRPNSGTL